MDIVFSCLSPLPPCLSTLLVLNNIWEDYYDIMSCVGSLFHSLSDIIGIILCRKLTEVSGVLVKLMFSTNDMTRGHLPLYPFTVINIFLFHNRPHLNKISKSGTIFIYSVFYNS